MLALVNADARALPIADRTVQTAITSPPYFNLREYDAPGQIGREDHPDRYVAEMLAALSEVYRVLKDDGVLWLNLGSSSWNEPGNGRGGGSKLTGGAPHLSGSRRLSPFLPRKSDTGIPWRVALGAQGFAVVPFRSFSAWADELAAARRANDWLAVEVVERRLRSVDVLSALQSRGWVLRADCIWYKPNALPQSYKDRPTAAHEYVFMLTKRPQYYYNYEAGLEPALVGHAGSSFVKGKTLDAARQRAEPSHAPRIDNGKRNRRTVWEIAVARYSGAHYATYPPELIAPLVATTSRPGDLVLDPFVGSGTTGEVCRKMGRRFIGTDVSLEYLRNHARVRVRRETPAAALADLPMFETLK